MPINLVGPDLAVSLHLDEFAPRAARYHVTHVDHPSPDLRDAVALLTSELVSRAVQHNGSDVGESLELRAWMPPDVVRVELRAPHGLLEASPDPGGTQYDLVLLDQVADRWSIDENESSDCMWFEIDRHFENRH
ncbi:MAG TPA: hypothetical protein VGO14_05595 [Solirubrobacteraceae bacterium]|jgi:hypothetical protein|nr:hypothetical protein [Solirubrobacteraceae bacterium]